MLSLRILKTEFDMRHRPKRENYPIGFYGEINYQERLERYCTYLENRNKELTEQCNIANVVGRSEQLKAFLDYCDEAGWIKNLDKNRVIKDYEQSL